MADGHPSWDGSSLVPSPETGGATPLISAAVAASGCDDHDRRTAPIASRPDGPDLLLKLLGHPLSCGQLARMLAKGLGGSADPARARIAAEHSCRLNDPTGCDVLATIRLDQAVPGANDQNSVAAVAALEIGCNAGIANSCERLATQILFGDGAAFDSRRAKACDLKHGDACYSLAFMLANPQLMGVLDDTPDAPGARALWAKACALDS